MALADIMSRIEIDADAEAALIMEAARLEAAEVLEGARSRADDARSEIVAEAELAAERERRTRLANARLQARDRLLKAKLELADRVLRQAEAAIVALPDDDYAVLLAGELAGLARGGETVHVAKADAKRLSGLGEVLASETKKLGRNVEVVFGDPTDELERGVMLLGERMSVEVSPAGLVAAERETLLAKASATLFADGEA